MLVSIDTEIDMNKMIILLPSAHKLGGGENSILSGWFPSLYDSLVTSFSKNLMTNYD